MRNGVILLEANQICLTKKMLTSGCSTQRMDSLPTVSDIYPAPSSVGRTAKLTVCRGNETRVPSLVAAEEGPVHPPPPGATSLVEGGGRRVLIPWQ